MYSCLAFVGWLGLLNSHLPSWGQASLVNLDVYATVTSSQDLLSQQEISGRQMRGPGFPHLKGRWKGRPIELGSKANLGPETI